MLLLRRVLLRLLRIRVLRRHDARARGASTHPHHRHRRLRILSPSTTNNWRRAMRRRYWRTHRRRLRRRRSRRVSRSGRLRVPPLRATLRRRCTTICVPLRWHLLLLILLLLPRRWLLIILLRLRHHHRLSRRRASRFPSARRRAPVRPVRPGRCSTSVHLRLYNTNTRSSWITRTRVVHHPRPSRRRLLRQTQDAPSHRARARWM
mmetsp:Transcript_1845/g.6821  ORF Transcript_1845/g.6821 Transcript_1845/m.6821 type:complete len:206 (-) Transcript_1845:117-734(-)